MAKIQQICKEAKDCQIIIVFNKILQLKMQKRYQQLPNQFIPKHSQKYLMRKTLVNTKFQWLMKYLHHENEQNTDDNWKLSRAIKIAPKETFNNRFKKTFFEGKTLTNNINNYNNIIKAEENNQQKIMTTHSATLRRSILKSRNNTEPAKNPVFLEKSKVKNHSLLLHKSKSKRISLLFNKESHQTITHKMKTTAGIKRSKTGEVRRYKKEKENFALTPWILPEENQENSDLVSYF